MEGSIDKHSTLSWIGQMMQDFYYKELQADSDFFEAEHFIYCAKAVYAKLIDTAAKESRQLDKLESGYYTISLSQDWLIEEEVGFEEDKRNNGIFIGQLKRAPYAFSFDRMSYSVQTVEPLDNDCNSYTRISADQRFKFRHIASTNMVFFYVLGDKIYLVNQSTCTPKKAIVWYAPSLAGEPDEVIIPLNKHFDIVTIGAKLMADITANTVVDKTNNQNTNKIIQSEIDKNTIQP